MWGPDMNMLLLKFAKLIPLEEEDMEKWADAEWDVEMKRILYRRTKEFVISGYTISATESLGLTENERRCYYDCKEQVLRENLGLQGLATREDPMERKALFEAEREFVPTKDDLTYDYLKSCSMKVMEQYADIRRRAV